MIDIPEVVRYARLCLLRRINLAAQPMHLGPPSHARSHAMAMKIVSDRFVIEPLAGFHRHHMRSRTDQRHVAAEHVEELRQLIQTQAAQNATHSRDT